MTLTCARFIANSTNQIPKMYLNSKAFTGGENDIPRLHWQAMADLRIVVDKWKPEDFSPDDYEIVSGSVIQRLPCLDGRFAVHAYNIFTPKK